ncbi:MAG TPA: hypothetical protein VGG42_09955 [Acidobacteriaceae bacterium]|jgi:hypothetical protein
MPFVKLDCGILDSSLWVNRVQRDLFITALLMAEPYELKEPTDQIAVRSLEKKGFVVPPGWYGFIPAAGTGIVRRAGYQPKEVDVALDALEVLGEPDEDSRSEDFGGRRLVRINGGYLALNYMKWRDFDYGAKDRMRRLRERKKEGGVTRTFGSVRRNVTHSREQIAEADLVESSVGSNSRSKVKTCDSSNIGQLPLAEALDKPATPPEPEPQAKSEPEAKPAAEAKPKPAKPAKGGTPDPTEAIYQAYPRHIGKRVALAAIDKAIVRLLTQGEVKGGVFLTRADAERWLWKTLATFARSPAGNRGSLTPHPSTWFNQSRYLDDPAEWQRTEEASRGTGAKQSVAAGNFAAARENIRQLREGRRDHGGDHAALFGLRTPDDRHEDLHALPGSAGGSDSGGAGDSVLAGGAGRGEILPPAGEIAAVGGSRNRGPVF